MKMEEISRYLREYEGRPLTLMEVCGSHTAAIAKCGIKDILSDKIKLISGPGCPVCVTPSAYIDKLIEIAKEPGCCVASFGDMLRVPGSVESLSEAKSKGASTVMVYSPMDVLGLAAQNPETTYVFAAVGFETTAPVYTLLIEEAQRQNLDNIKLLTSLKTMPNVLEWLLEGEATIDGFLAPGHVCAITGSEYFAPLARRYKVPMAVSGFKDKELLLAIYGLVKMAQEGIAEVRNYYPSVVESCGNTMAIDRISRYFKPYNAVWRGVGEVKDSGLILREEYSRYDAGSIGLAEDIKRNQGCCCGQILMGRMEPKDCPLFGKVCSPDSPQGACMVSYEGSCYQNYLNS